MHGQTLIETSTKPREWKQASLPLADAWLTQANASRLNGLANWTEFCRALSHEHHCQMSNRFAWLWKLAELDDTVILVYLGFLGAVEMRKWGEQNPVYRHA